MGNQNLTELFLNGTLADVRNTFEEMKTVSDSAAAEPLTRLACACWGALPRWRMIPEGTPITEIVEVSDQIVALLDQRCQSYCDEITRPRIKAVQNSNLLHIFQMNRDGDLNSPWWHDNAVDLWLALDFGSEGCTTNPPIVWTAVDENNAKWNPIIEETWRYFPGYTAEQICLEVTIKCIAENAALLRPIYDLTGGSSGVISIQLDPTTAHDPDAMLAQALYVKGRLAEMDITNVVFKVAGTHSGLEIVGKIMAETQMNVNVTVNYMLRQQYEFACKIEAAGLSGWSYLTQMNGRLAEPIGKELKSLGVSDWELIQRWSMHAVRQQTYAMLLQNGFVKSRPLGAAGRGTWDIDGSTFNGPIATCMTVFPPRQWEYDAEPRDINPNGLWTPLPAGYLNKLMKSPTFRMAYAMDGVTPKDFDTFPSTVATINQFVENYDKFVEHCAKCRPADLR